VCLFPAAIPSGKLAAYNRAHQGESSSSAKNNGNVYGRLQGDIAKMQQQQQQQQPPPAKGQKRAATPRAGGGAAQQAAASKQPRRPCPPRRPKAATVAAAPPPPPPPSFLPPMASLRGEPVPALVEVPQMDGTNRGAALGDIVTTFALCETPPPLHMQMLQHC